METSNIHGMDRFHARERDGCIILSKRTVCRALLSAALLTVFLPLFTGCRTVLHTPDAEELLSFARTSFVCGFSAAENGAPGIPCALTRTDTEDLLCVTMPHGTVTFSFSGGQTYLSTGGETDGGAFSVPVTLLSDTGAAYWRSLFCLFPAAYAAVTRTDDGYCVSDPASGILVYCSADGLPTRIVSGSVTLTVTAFIPQGDQKS